MHVNKLFFVFFIADSKPSKNADMHERRLWENLSLDKWPTRLYELVKGTNTEGFATLFTTIEACE